MADVPRILTYDEGPFGFSWVIDEPMLRTSHALVDDAGKVWLVDPVDAEGAIAKAQKRGRVAGVIQLLDRHDRDCAAVAARVGAPHLKLPAVVTDSPFQVIRVIDRPGWREHALWWPGRSVLVVAELVGTNPLWSLDVAPAGIHPMVRLIPSGALRGRQPRHLLVGHGGGVHDDAAAPALETAYARSRRDVPRLLMKLPGALLGARKG